MQKLLYVVAPFLFCVSPIYAQNTISELEEKIKNASNDSIRAVELDNLAWELMRSNPAKGVAYGLQAIKIAEANNYTRLAGACHNTVGNCYDALGQYNHAEEHLVTSASFFRICGNLKGVGIVYSNLGKVYRKKGEFSKGIDFVNQAIKLHDSLQFQYGLKLAYTNKGTLLNDLGDLRASFLAHQKAHEITLKGSDSLEIGQSFINLGSILHELGDYEKGIDYTLQGLALVEKMKDDISSIRALNNLSIMNRRINNLSSAQRYNNKAEKLATKGSHFQFFPEIFNSKAELLLIDKQAQKALESLKKAQKYLVNYPNKVTEIEVMGNMGEAYFQLNNMDSARYFLSQAVDEAQKKNMHATEFRCLLSLSKLETNNKNYNQTKIHLDRLKLLQTKVKSRKLLMDFHKTSIDYYKKTDNQDRLLRSYESYFTLRDSILPDQVIENMSDAMVKYETEKKSQTIKNLALKSEVQRLRIKQAELKIREQFFWIAAITLFFLLFILFARMLFLKQRKLNMLKMEISLNESLEKERSRLAKDLHDDLGSGLSKIRFLSEGIAIDKTDEKLQNKIKLINSTADELVENMRELIWVLQPENQTLSNLIARCREYIGNYLEDTNIDGIVHETIPNNPVPLSPEKSRNIFLIVKEALQNTLKHTKATKFDCSFALNDERLTIKISDNGAESVQRSSNSSGNGLKNMKYRVNNMGATFETYTKNGFHIVIHLNV